MNKTIVKNNKLIAEFMEYKPTKCNNGFAWDYEKSKPSKDHLFPIQGRLITQDCSYLKFHQSWDWIIPVIEKINECHLFGSQHLISTIDKNLLLSDITSVYESVIKFIEWYNLQNKKEN